LYCPTDQSSIAFLYLLQLLVQWHLGPLLFFLGVYSDSTRNAGPIDCGSGVFTDEEINGVGDMGSRDTATIDVQMLLKVCLKDPHLGLFSSTAEVPVFLEYQLMD